MIFPLDNRHFITELSNLYDITLDELIKGDEKMIEHLEESTNTVRSSKQLIGIILLNIFVMTLLITLGMFLPDNKYYLVVVFCLAVVSSSLLLYQIIKRI